MNSEDKNLKFEKNLTKNQDNKTSKTMLQREKLKSKIMTKYNVNSEDAERIILKIKKKEANKHHKNEFYNNKHSKNQSNPNLTKSNSVTNAPQTSITSDKNNYLKRKSDPNNQKNKNLQKNKIFKKNHDNNDTSDFNNNYKKSLPQEKNVDSIINNIIPNYNNQISIELNHVDLTFEVQNEKIDTLKESFIRVLKRNKTKSFKIHALKDISFKIYKGEKVGIIGYNGAGKSTLLNVITGIYSPDKGNVKTFGNISPLLSLGAGFDHNYSGRKNIFLNGAVLGYDKHFLESKIDEIIEFSELGEYIDIPIKNYSSGMLAKLGFSIATSVNPDILIIDEILGVGDVNFRKKSSDKIKSLMDGGTTVLLVSHSVPQIREICDKAIWIDNGYLKDIGEVNKICDKYLKDAENASNKQLANIELDIK